MKKIVKIIILIGAIVLIVLMVNQDIKTRSNSDMDYVYVRLGEETINIFKTSSDEYYLFLPGYANEEDIVYSEAAKKLNINVLKSSNLDTIFISTSTNTLDNIYANKEYSETGKISVFSKDGNAEYEGGLKSVKGRGNYSWNNWDKKPFSISLSKENDSILGLPGGGSFALIANASDATFLRNEIARRLEVKAEISFSHTGKFVDLYINGDYMGNYYLMDTVDIGEERINVTNLDGMQKSIYKKSNPDAYDVVQRDDLKAVNLPLEPSLYSGGYLIEREFEGRYKLELDATPSGFVTKKGEYFFVRSPKYCSVKETEYLKDFIDKTEEAIYRDSDEYKNYIDMESFARRYLVEEVMKNYDAGVSSAYFYKDTDSIDGHLKAATGWDYDMSLGNYLDWMEYYNEDPTGLTLLSVADSHSEWWKILYNKKDFQNKVKEIYKNDISDFYLSLADEEIDNYHAYLRDSSLMDSVRWKDMYEEKGYSPDDENEFEKLKQFIRIRKDYLDSVWITE